jgi:hypothetical protein
MATQDGVRKTLREAGHLVRLAIVILAALGIFLLLRGAVVPEEFGKYGHYRPGALDDNRNRPLFYAGQEACLGCHEDVETARKGGKHQGIKCEACHGPQGRHAEDPYSARPQLPDASALCVRCHESDSAKPRGFPQVVSKEHSMGEACKSCHQPHQPKP